MNTALDVSIRELKENLVLMGGHVERALEHATEALLEWNVTKIDPVFEIEKKVNQSHIGVDEECIQLLARHQPMAADLRLIVATLKINTDLERMGDQAVNIAQNAKRYLAATPIKPLVDLPQMSKEVRIMVRASLDAFVQRSEEGAREVLRRDDAVDAYKNKIFRDVLDHMKANPQDVEQGLNLILIARNLERIGDHATNIAEDVIYAISGEDVRHAPKVNQLNTKETT
jgi:phosphate transport system protein